MTEESALRFASPLQETGSQFLSGKNNREETVYMGKIYREFAEYISLSVAGMLAISCYILADTFFVSQRLGTDGLAALNLAIPIYDVIHGTGLMLGMGGATRFSICKSRGEDREANLMFTNTLFLAGACSVFFVLTGLLFSERLAVLLGADEAVLEMTNTYLKVLMLFSPAFLLNDIFLCFVRNDKNPGMSMRATIGGSFSNIILDYVFMFPLGMGIFGAALATGLAPVIGIAIMSPHWLKRSKGFHAVKTGLLPKQVKMNVSLGFPSLLAQLSSGIVMIVFNKIILELEGNTGVAAYGVTANIALVVVAVYSGVGQGIQPLVSREYGYGRKEREVQLLRWAAAVVLALSVLIYGGLFGFAEPIVGIFNSENSERMGQIAVSGLKLYFISVPFVGLNIVLSTYFSAVEQAVPAQVISLLRGLVLLIPMAFFMAEAGGLTGVWLAVPVTEFLSAVLGGWLYFRMEKRAARRAKSQLPEDI